MWKTKVHGHLAPNKILFLHSHNRQHGFFRFHKWNYNFLGRLTLCSPSSIPGHCYQALQCSCNNRGDARKLRRQCLNQTIMRFLLHVWWKFCVVSWCFGVFWVCLFNRCSNEHAWLVYIFWYSYVNINVNILQKMRITRSWYSVD